MPRETAIPEPLPEPTVPRRRRWPWVVAAVVLLPVAAGGIFLAGFDLNGQKPRIEAAVEQATGRDLTLDGPIGVKFSLVPTLTVEGASLANMPGGSRPQMATVQRVELELALLPLLSRRVEVRRLRLVAPDILLETNAEGQPNWVFRRAAPGAAPDAPPPGPPPGPRPAEAPPEAGGRRLSLSVGKVAVEAGKVTWRDGQTGASRTLGIPALEIAAEGDRGPVRGRGSLTLDGAPIAVEGEAGPLLGLTDPVAGTPWPIRLSLAAAGATAVLEGSIDRPRERRGWKARLTAQVPDTQALVPLLPNLPLLPLRDVRAQIGLADAGPGRQALTGLDVSIGASPLDPLLPGLALAGFTARQAGPEAPLVLDGSGALHGVPVTLKGTTGSPMLLRPGSQGAMPVDLVATAAGATATVKGSIGDPRRIGDVALLVALGVPDLAVLSPLAGTPLPPVKDLTAGFTLAERGFAFSGGAFLKGLRIASSAGDAEGELTYVIGMRQGLHGTLASRRVDLDALQPPAGPAAAPAAAPAPPPPRDGRVIPDIPLPLELLRVTDSELRWTVGELHTGGIGLRDTAAHVEIRDGKGRLDPFTTSLPGGHLSLRAAADITTTPPSLQVAAQSDGIDLPTLLAALHVPGGTAGRAEIDLDLRGQGRDLRAVAATATGHLGLALTNGRIESGSGSLLGRVLGELRQSLPQLGALAEGHVTLSCAATRWRAEGGIARAETLLLDGSLGKVGGGGSVNLRDETLALRLQLDLRLPIPGVNQLRIRAPLPVGGTLANPRPDYGPAVTRGAIGSVEGLAQIPGNLAGEILGALGGRESAPAGGLPDCGPALAAARGGRAGPMPAPAPAGAEAAGQPASPAPAERAPLRNLPGPAQDLLRGLLRGR